MTVKVTNTAGGDIVFRTPPEVVTQIFIGREKSGGYTAYELPFNLSAAGKMRAVSIDLPGGGSLVFAEMLLLGRPQGSSAEVDYLFSEPGAYHVYARMSGDGNKYGESQSNELTLEVHQPAGIDARAFDLFRGMDQARFLLRDHRSREMDERAIERLSRLATLFPQSAYAPHALYALGEYNFEHYQFDSGMVTSDYGAAERFYAGVLRTGVRSIPSDQIRVRLAKSIYSQDSSDLSRRQRAQELITEVVAGDQASPSAGEAKALLRELEPTGAVSSGTDRGLQ